MSTSVADVSALLTTAPGTVNQTSAASQKSSETESFTSYMNTSAEKSEPDTQEMNEPVRQTKTVVEKPGRKDLEQQQPDDMQVTDEIEISKDPIDAVSESIIEIKDAIQSKFEISDEELIRTMETLNMTMVDLLDPDMLKDLMITLNGQEDIVSALTDEVLYTDMMDIVNLTTDLTNEVKETFRLNDEDFAKVIEDVRTVETEQGLPEMPKMVSVEPENNLETPVASKEMPIVEDEEELPQTETKAPEIRVEIRHSEETRTADPIVRETQDRATPISQMQESVSDSTQTSTTQTVTQPQSMMQKDETEEQDASAQMAQSQQSQTSTQQVGDVVETVRTFSRYTENGEEIVRQLTDSIKVNISPEETSMELQLHPASLGAIHLNIASQNGIVTAQILVQNETVKGALEAQMAQLQETFAEQGTKVEAVEVAVASYDLNRGPFQDRDDRQDRQNADDHSRTRRRVNLNLNDLNADELELSEEDQLAKDVMEMNGTSVDFSA